MKKGNVLLSIIIPVYNLEKYIVHCLDSLVVQIEDNVEIIIIDDGSKDKSGDICKEYSSKYHYIKYFYQENAGVSAARNYGISKSVGKYIQFVDGDDFVLLNSIPEILQKIKLDKFDVIVGDFVKVYDDEVNVNSLIKNNNIIEEIENDVYPKNMIKVLTNNMYRTSTCFNIFKSDIIFDNNIKFNDKVKYTEDLDFCFSAFFKCKHIGVLEHKFYAYRQARTESATSICSKKRVVDNLNFIKKWYNYYQNSELDEEVKDYLINFLSYEYTIVFGLLFMLCEEDFKNMYELVYEYKWLLKYKRNKKVKLVSLVNNIVGFNNTGKLLAVFIKNKSR